MSDTKPMTLTQFRSLYPDDDACLEHLMRVRYGDRHCCSKCKKDAHYYRVKKRRSYECEYCGHQVYPTAGTPFEKTRTNLTSWFHAMFMFCSTRNGVAAKELQRQLGVTYKTAWRMGHEIRKYMAYVDGDAPLGGSGPGAPIVEADKTFVGGRDKKGQDDKAVVLGMAERGGEVITRILDGRGEDEVVPELMKHVRDGSKVATDEAGAFMNLWRLGFAHGTVNHRAKEYVRGAVHTNTIEAFWGNLKRGITGTHVWVSKKHLQKYLCEFEYRHNLRKQPELMLALLLIAFSKPVALREP
jgi:ribosomal protein L37AE/L43A